MASNKIISKKKNNRSLSQVFEKQIEWIKKHVVMIIITIFAAGFSTGVYLMNLTNNIFISSQNSRKSISQYSNNAFLMNIDFLYSSIIDSGCYIMLSNPPVYKFLNKGDERELERISKVNFNKFNDELCKKYDIVKIAYEKVINKIDTFNYLLLSPNQYTGLGEAIGLQRISCFFKSNNIHFDVTQSIKNYPQTNTILLGGWISHKKSEQTVSKIEKLHREWNIRYCIFDGAIFLDKKPTKYNQSFEDHELILDYAIITKAPHPYDYSKVIIICAGINSQGTQKAAEIISNIDDLIRLKNSIENKFGNIPNWFQAIIEIPIKDGEPIKNWICQTVESIEKKK